MSGIAGRIITIHHGGGGSAPAAPVKLCSGPLENKHFGYESSDLSVASLPLRYGGEQRSERGRGAGLRCRGQLAMIEKRKGCGASEESPQPSAAAGGVK